MPLRTVSWNCTSCGEKHSLQSEKMIRTADKICPNTVREVFTNSTNAPIVHEWECRRCKELHSAFVCPGADFELTCEKTLFVPVNEFTPEQLRVIEDEQRVDEVESEEEYYEGEVEYYEVDGDGVWIYVMETDEECLNRWMESTSDV